MNCYVCSGLLMSGLNAIMGPTGSGKTRYVSFLVQSLEYLCMYLHLINFWMSSSNTDMHVQKYIGILD